MLRTPYRRLSGGQQQAVNLAAALVGRPELVFLDEPTAGMDPHARLTTWRLLERLRAARCTTLSTSHLKRVVPYRQGYFTRPRDSGINRRIS